MRRALLFTCLAMPAWSWAQSAESSPEPLVEEALTANPSIERLRARARALEARADVAGAWPDPMLAVEYSNVPVTTFGLSDHPMAGLQLRVQQVLRPPGWSRLSREIGDLKTEAGSHAVDEAELGLALGVRRTWWLLARTRLLRAVTQEHLARTEELLGAVRARYETGGVGQHAVLRLEVLRERLSDELEDFDRSEVELTAMLDEALARGGTGRFETPSTSDPIEPPGEADWTSLAQAHRPLLARLEAERSASEQSARLARVDGIPDPSVWAGYRIRTVQTDMDPGTDLVSIGVGVPIPTGSGRRAKGRRAAALEEASAAESAYESALDGIASDIAAILARWRRAWSKADTFERSLIPGARATLEASQSDFSVGRADFSSLFEAEVALLDLERGRIVATIETHIQQAEATAVLGIAAAGGQP